MGHLQPVAEPALTPELIRERADAVMTRLRDVAASAGRDPSAVRLVAVTKGFGVPVVRAAAAAGLMRFGENRVQEAPDKVEAVPAAEWHLVGHLQSNKARAALRLFGTIHSVDALDLLHRLDRIATEEAVTPAILLQVNVAGEARKAGFDGARFADEVGRVGDLVAAVQGLAAARVVGLMAMAPFGAAPAEQRTVFGRLRELRDALEQRIGQRLPELSMGMTADAEAAVAEGATLVRIGTAIFGPRPYR